MKAITAIENAPKRLKQIQNNAIKNFFIRAANLPWNQKCASGEKLLIFPGTEKFIYSGQLECNTGILPVLFPLGTPSPGSALWKFNPPGHADLPIGFMYGNPIQYANRTNSQNLTEGGSENPPSIGSSSATDNFEIASDVNIH
ncbi:MAG: hypothetical protein WCP55_05810 [Lentisphaerota bacterium]